MAPQTLGGLGQLADQINEEIVGHDRVIVKAIAHKARQVKQDGMVNRKLVHTNVKGRIHRVHCPRHYTRKQHLPQTKNNVDAVFVTIEQDITNKIFVARLTDVEILPSVAF